MAKDASGLLRGEELDRVMQPSRISMLSGGLTQSVIIPVAFQVRAINRQSAGRPEARSPFRGHALLRQSYCRLERSVKRLDVVPTAEAAGAHGPFVQYLRSGIAYKLGASQNIAI